MRLLRRTRTRSSDPHQVRRILIADDDPAIANLVRMALDDPRYEVAAAGTGLDAIQQFRKAAFDLVILDIMMPYVDGFEACQRIRETSDVPIVILTSRGGVDDVVHGFDGPMAANPIGVPARFGIASMLLVPMVARSRTVGVLLLGMGPSGRRFDAEALTLAKDLAGRGATALENARLYRKIQEEDQRKNEFLAMLAHELRNPLAPISNAIHVLHAEEANPERLAWAKEVIGRQLKQLVRLVDDLLDVSRITRGKIQLRIETVDVSRVMAAAIETSRPFIDSLEHQITVALPEHPVYVRGDSARVAQILSNLITNAAKYTEKSGHIDISAVREGNEIVFRVRDTGVGIPKEALATIFELFSQVDGTLDRSRGGLGIGLTLVRRLVEMQGGSVQAYSAGNGRGSEFTVRLPATEAECSGETQPAVPSLMSAQPGVRDRIPAGAASSRTVHLPGGRRLRCLPDGPRAVAPPSRRR